MSQFGQQVFLEVLTLLDVRHCPKLQFVQYQDNLMKQTWKNDKKLNFGPDFGSFGTNLGPKFFFAGFIYVLSS